MEAVREGRHLAAIMFVDLVGYSARMQDNEPRAIAAVRDLWERVRPILAEHGGREVDLAGDGMLMEFAGALAAVRCAQAIHASLRESNKALPESERLRVRAGVHLGDIEHKAGRIYGDGVNIAARIIAIAPPGGVAMSAHVRDQVHNVLDQPVQKLGAKKLKGIKQPVEVWCLPGPECSAADLAGARAAAADASASRRWSFEDVVFDERTLELSVAGVPAGIEKKSLDVLAALLARAGEVVTKDELLEAVWPGRIPSESVLTTAMAKLRAALDDDDQRLIRTVHGYGYRLAAAVKVEALGEAPAAHFDFKEGDTLPARPHWRLVRLLGHGGHGEAWLARHEKTGEERVYKFALDADRLASLRREITLSRVLAEAYGSKGCFARILDWNLDSAPCFLEAEYSRDGSLTDWVAARGGLASVPLATRLDIAAQAAEAVALAHAVGVLHKDLKPTNLLIEAGDQGVKVRLSDFGSGGVLDPDRLAELGITRMGFTKLALDESSAGTPLYLAPEVVAGQPFTSKADLYALGVMLYQLAVGDFSRAPAPGWERDVDDELLREDIAAAASGRPDARLGDAQALAQRLRTLEQRRATRMQDRRKAAEDEKQRRKYESYRVRRWWVAGLTAVIAAGFVAAFFYWFDAQIATAHALEALDGIAAKLEREGRFDDAAALFRQVVNIKQRQELGPLFPGGLLPWEYYFDSRLDVARTEMEGGHLLPSLDDYARLLDDAARALGTGSPYYAFLSSNYGECLLRAGKLEKARVVLGTAQPVLQAASAGHPGWLKDNTERLARLAQAPSGSSP